MVFPLVFLGFFWIVEICTFSLYMGWRLAGGFSSALNRMCPPLTYSASGVGLCEVGYAPSQVWTSHFHGGYGYGVDHAECEGVVD